MDFSDFHFESPWLLVLGFVVAAALFMLLRWSQNRRQRSLATFAAERLLAQLTANFSAPRRLTKDLALALARPSSPSGRTPSGRNFWAFR